MNRSAKPGEDIAVAREALITENMYEAQGNRKDSTFSSVRMIQSLCVSTLCHVRHYNEL